MNILKSLVAALLLIIAPVILESCCDTVCGNCTRSHDAEAPARYDFDGMSMNLLNRANYKELTSNTVALSDISFMVDIDAHFTSMLSTHSSFAAYACEPPSPIANQKIESIVITSNNDMTTNVSTIPQGEDLASIFFVVVEHDYGPINNWTVGQPFFGDNLEFISEARVTSSQTHVFTFRISLDNGEVFEMTTRELNLKVN